MLNKKFCKLCVEQYCKRHPDWVKDSIDYYISTFNDFWEDGYCMCPHRNVGKANLSVSTSNPPKNCPYILEYIVNA
jgi:hypothetical protein